MKILITGTTQGIGKQLFEDLSKSHDVYSLNRRGEKSPKNFICDLSNLADVTKVCSEIKEHNFDCLINNAGGSLPIKFEDLTLKDIEDRVNLNFISPLLLIQSVIENMKLKEFGRIINISSVTAKTPVPYLHIYSSAKSALNSLTISLARYYNNCNITINTVCPGAINTNSSVEGRKIISSMRNIDENKYQENMIASTGLNDLLSPQDVSNFVQYLLSDKANHINGQSFNICGTMEVN